VTRVLAVLAAFVAVLVTAPAAMAATFVVNDNGDLPDPQTTTDPNCDTDANAANGLQCTLRAAIMQANATPGADAITFAATGHSPAPATALPAVTDQLTIDGGGNTTVTFAPAATGTLLAIQADNSTVKAITLTGGSGTMLGLGGSGDRADSVTVRNAGGAGVAITGPNATVSAPDISGSGSDGIDANSDGASISGGTIHNNSGSGVAITGQNNSVSHVVFYGNGGKPIAVASGANGGIVPPQNLRIGPRRADGSLPLTGTTTSGGTIELWSGDPAGASPPSLLDTFSASGDFTYNFASEPQPGSVFAASLTSGGLGSSEFATVAVPADIASPDVTFSRALDTANVRVDFTEPVDPATVQKEDFKLTMAGLDRPISAASVSQDGRAVILTSGGWQPGEAGYVQINAVGSVNDSAGNAMLSAPRIRVAAAPGDFVAPLGSRLSVSPKTICLTRARSCRKPGMTITFFSTEPGKATLLIKRSNVTMGKRLYPSIVAGRNTLKFNGLLGARKLRAGRYRLLMYVQDQVGNVTLQPPITLFNVRRVSK
jgi:hypothetical protein